MSRPFRQSLRFKLLIVSLSLLAIPWAGYRFIRDSEALLRELQDQQLGSAAGTLANGLAHSGLLPDVAVDEGDIYLHPLPFTPQLDGYPDEWRELWPQWQAFSGAPSFKALAGSNADNLYLMLQAEDSSPDYATTADPVYHGSDQLELQFGSGHNILIAPHAPGRITALTRVRKARGWITTGKENRVQGEWQENGAGYSIELRLPRSLVGEHLRITLFDRSRNTAQSSSAGHGRLITPDPLLEERLAALVPEAHRAWVVNRNGFVLARHGHLDTMPTRDANQAPPWFIRRLFAWVLEQPTERGVGPDPTHSRIHIRFIEAALQNEPRVHHYPLEGHDGLVAMASQPIPAANSSIRGVLMLEHSGEAILSLQNQALQNLITLTLSAMLIVTLLLLGYASLLTRRIRGLLRRIDGAVSPDGRVMGKISPPSQQDEIGELGRGFARVLSRLAGYNDYLEQLGSRLTHELRTPITVVRTSLESQQEIAGDSDSPYLQRAAEGAARLELIIKQLSEATRLERLFEQTERHAFDLSPLVAANVAIWRENWPTETFALQTANPPLPVVGATELITQALEKIIGNAIDFHVPGSAIEITVGQEAGTWAVVTICNKGPALPEGVDPFRSMLSVRKEKDDTPHLGLGLYLVQLITRFHQGEATAFNRSEGVCVSLRLPLANTK